MRNRPKNLTDQVVDTLGASIATGKRPAGSPLPTEQLLLAEFQASRTVLREALKVLAAKGLISTRPRRGTIVEPESAWNLSDADILNWLLQRKNTLPLMLEFADIRLAIEPAAASLAAARRDPEGIAAISAALARMQDAMSGEADAVEADIEFHLAILKATDNRFFWSLRHMIEVALRFVIRVTNQRKGVEQASYDEHRRIYERIEAHDGATAEALMRSMLIESKVLLHEELRRQERNLAQSGR